MSTDPLNDRDPTLAEWIKAGCNVPCDGCDDGEPTECQMFGGEALCVDCLQVARVRKLDSEVGTMPGTPIYEPRWGGSGIWATPGSHSRG